MGDILVNILGIATGNQNRNVAPAAGREASRSGSWSRSRGHKSHGRKHGKKA